LLSGHHSKISEWKREQARLRTQANRPDLLH
jgi:tRNA (guanine-N1)-methyltransferase